MLFLGFFGGGVAVGPFADKLGRRHTIYVFGFIIALFSLLTAFAHAYWLFAVFRFLIGVGIGEFQLIIFGGAGDSNGSKPPRGHSHKKNNNKNTGCSSEISKRCQF